MNTYAAIVTVFVAFILITIHSSSHSFRVDGNHSSDRPYLVFGSIALIAHLIVGLFVIPQLPYGWDIGNFHDAAVTILDGSPEGSSSVVAFGAFQAILYVVFEPRREVLTVFNSLFAVLLPIPACYIAKQLYPSALRSAYGLMLFVLFFPVPFLFMTIPMRDAFSVFLAFGMLALFVHAYARREVWPIVLSIPALGMLFLVRAELALLLLLGGAAGGTVFVLNAISARQLSLLSSSLALAPVGVVGILLSARIFPFDKLSSEASWRAQGGAVYLEWMEYDSVEEMIIAAPTRAIFFQYAPFPLQAETTFHALPLVALPLLILCTVGAYRSLLGCRIDTVVATTLLTVYFGGIIGYGIVTSNFGTGVRHRMMFTFLLLVFAAPVLERWERSLSNRLGIREKENRHQSE